MAGCDSVPAKAEGGSIFVSGLLIGKSLSQMDGLAPELDLGFFIAIMALSL